MNFGIPQELKDDFSGLAFSRKIAALILLLAMLICIPVFVLFFNIYSILALVAFFLLEYLYSLVVKTKREPLLISIFK